MTNKNFRKHSGAVGEEIAKNYLQKNGFKILETNFHYSRIAEIDIIALKDNILHFVEVKTRSSNKFGTPLEAITHKKFSLIFQGAKFYMQTTKEKFKKFQIDAIAIILSENMPHSVEFLENISF